jgi:hypothetical protein
MDGSEIHEGDESVDMALEPYLSEDVQERDSMNVQVDEPIESEDDENSEVNQLVIDETTTTLISSKRKGINSVYKPYKKIFSIPTKNFCDRLDRCLSSTELLPRNVRYYISSHRGSMLVIEEEPCVRSINVDYNFESDIENLKVTGKLEEFGYTDFLKDMPPYRFTLSFPYVVYVLQVLPFPHTPSAKLCVFYRSAPLTSLYDSLFKCNLLNVDSKSFCCLGHIEVPKDADLNTKVNMILDSFWNSTFNREIRDCYNSYEQNAHLSTFLHWQYYSSKDPMFIMSEEFIASEHTVVSAIGGFDYDGEGGRKLLDSYKSIADLLFDENSVRNEDGSLYSVSQMPLVKDGSLLLDSGEEIVLYNEKCFVVDFLRNEKSFIKIRVETQKSGVIDVNLTPAVIKSLVSQIKDRKYVESITVKDREIKPGRVIRFNGPCEEYTTVVRKILKDRDGSFLTKCGRDYYLLENIDFEIFDENQVGLRGIKLEKGKKYVVMASRSEHFPYFYKTETPGAVVYNGFTNIDDDDAVCLKFGDSGIIEFDSLKNYNIFPEEGIEKLEVARYGRRLLEGCSRVRGNGLYAKSIKSLTSQVVSKLTKEITEKQELLIQSYDFDIKFSVGDKVVVPDWSRPETVTQIRTITGFRTGPNSESINIISVGNEGEAVFERKYLDFSDIARVNVGSVRKISEEFNGIKAGFKMVAKVRGVQNFMKKDCYNVIGFLTDTGNGIPLMLCSNLCTIWCIKEDLEKFDFFVPSSSKFNRLQVSQPLLNSSSFQPGDLIFSGRSRSRCCDETVLLLLNKPGFGQALTVVKPETANTCKCYRDTLNPIFFYGIPSPRIKLDPKVLTEGGSFERVVPFPGFHNTILDIAGRNYSNAKIYIRREEKSNVSNLFSR